MKISLIPMLLILLLIGGCLGDDDDSNPTGPQEHAIVGTWIAVTETIYWGDISNPDSSQVRDYNEENIIEMAIFSSDGRLEITRIRDGETYSEANGTWSISGTTITISMEAHDDKEAETGDFQYVITEDLMTLTREMDNPQDESGADWMVMVFARE